VGAGVVGAATAAYLLDAGADVTCYEAVAPLSQRSAGTSRIFRLLHGTPELVDLARTSRELYRQWDPDLIASTGAVLTGSRVDACCAAMSAAGAEYRISERVPLPLARVPGPVLVDPAGGVLDAHGVARYLTAKIAGSLVRQRVTRLEHHDDATRLWTDSGPRDIDATVICAGAATADLAAQVGLRMPTATAHHARFTFRLTDPEARPPCLMDDTAPVATYQHLSAPGLWAVGALLPDEDVAWDRGRANVVPHARDITCRYVRERLEGVSDQPVAELYCSFPVGWGDGYVVERSGGFLAVHGDNLFKLAPVLGRALGEAALKGSTPPSTHP
jgi:sarcosine oxidase